MQDETIQKNNMRLPEHAEVIIIGGGVIGCSIAYHLTKIGITNVVLLERKQLTCGTTWHAAGLIGQLRSTKNLTELAKYTSELLLELEGETGQATGFRQNGSISIALNSERMEELKRLASMARNFGLDVDVIGPNDILERYPHLSLKDVVGGVYLPKDGQCNPIDVTQAYAKGARNGGAHVLEQIQVLDIIKENGKVIGVTTNVGDIRSETVVIASGMWSYELGRKAGINLPLHAAEHFYVVTEPIPGLAKNLPVLRVPDEWSYYKEDAGKILLGCFEPKAKPWGMNGIREDFCFDTLPEDLDHFLPVLEMGVDRFPLLKETGIQLWFNGPESFTPDDRYLLGEAPEVNGLFVACGFNSIGIQSSGGAGKVLAQWIKDRSPPLDLTDVDVRRMQPFQGNRAYLKDRTVETLGLLYKTHWPFYQYESARGTRRSPFYETLKQLGAVYGETAGWERPNWYAVDGVEKSYGYSYEKQNWFDCSRKECFATREAVALYDLSSMTNFNVYGKNALTLLDHISSNNINIPIGKVVYTQWLNDKGGIEADLTITRIAEDHFMVVSAAPTQNRDFHYLKKHASALENCFVVDDTSGIAMLGLMGPHARSLMQALAPHTDFSNQSFPFGTSKNIEIGYAQLRATRISYVGELGWELYIPTEFAMHVFERILSAGQPFGLTMAGMHAMNSCRMEKGYRHWGDDIGIEDTPINAGLGFAVAWNKPVNFIGREALLNYKSKEQKTHRTLLQFRLICSERLMYKEEPIYLNGKRAGAITSGMYGHRIEASCGLGYIFSENVVTKEWLQHQKIEIEIGWERYDAIASIEPFYDPKSLRLKS